MPFASLCQLLTRAPSDRYGCGEGGISNLKKHAWFRGIDWQAMVQKTAIPPFKPNVSSKKTGSLGTL